MITEKMRAKSFGLFALSILALVFVAGLASAAVVITAANPNVVDVSFTPQMGSQLVLNTTAFIGRTTTHTGAATGTHSGVDYIKWKITITGPEGKTLTPDMVDLDEVGFNDPTDTNPNPPSSIGTFHYPFQVVAGSLVSDVSTRGEFGSCDLANIHDNSCVHNIGFSLDQNDIFTNADKIRFNSNAPLGFYVITYELVDTFGADEVLSNLFTKTVSVTATTTPTSTLTETSICADAEVTPISEAELEVSIRDVTVTDGFGSNEDWLLFDEVEVEVRVENNGNFDLDDISLEWAIADDSLDFAVDWDEVDEFNLKDGDEDTFTVTFKVDDEDLDLDLDELAGNWNLVVRATGTIDDPDNGQFDNDDTCSADFEAVSVDEDNAVVLTNINVPDTLQCGQTYTITADAWNIGNDQEDEVKVDVFDRNRELIDELFDLGDIDEFENVELSFDLRVPQNAEAKTYTLVMRVLDEDSDVYEVGGDDDPSEFFAPLTVSGGCTTAGQVSVTANVVSGGREGQELVVRATVTNNGNIQQTYALNVAGHEDWASSASLDRSTLTLVAGQSQDVVATLDVNDNAAGSRTFFLEMTLDGQLTRQPVNVSVAESRGFPGLTGFAINSDNWYLWGIGLLNLILVIVIIVVAVRIARRK